MKTALAAHKENWSDRRFLRSVCIGVTMLIVSLGVNYTAVQYAIYSSSASTTDILLSNLPVVNTDFFFSEGAIIFILFVLALMVAKPKTIPYTLKSIALFIVIRSVFVIMTHYGPYSDHINADLDAIHWISSGADLFFSGHTGLPFLMALSYWNEKNLRRIFIVCSVVAAIAVLLGHLHYTIDVFSAYFITYGIHKIAERKFVADRILFLS